MTRYYGQHEPPVDAILEELLPAGFVGYAADVGAGDGITDSNTYLFEQRGWDVLCVEPSPPYFAACATARKRFVPSAAGNRSGIDKLHVFKTDGQWGGLTSLKVDERLRAEYHARGTIEGEWIVPVHVDRLNDLLDDAKFPRLDLLSVDTEGTELDVLRGLDLNRWKPLVVVVENNWNEFEVRSYLLAFGYSLVRRNNVNDFFGRLS